MSWRDYATERAGRTPEAFERSERALESSLARDARRERQLDYAPLSESPEQAGRLPGAAGEQQNTGEVNR